MSELPTLAFPESFNMARWFLDERVTRDGLGGKTAILDDAGKWTFAQVLELSQRVHGALVDGGVMPEDRVLIILDDSVEFAAAFFGVLRAGAVVTMANPDLPDDDYAYYLEYTRARAVIVESRVAARPAVGRAIAASAFCRARVVVRDEAPISLDRYWSRWSEAVLARAPIADAFDTSKDDPAVWLFTSGSTGKPKAAVHLHHDFPFNTECYAKGALGMSSSDLTLAVPKLYFGYATGSNLMFPFAVGGTAILFRDKATPERLFDLAMQHEATLLISVPTMINKMTQLILTGTEPARAGQLASVRACVSAGEALPVELYRRWKELTGVEILDGIGSAELFHIYISNTPGDVAPGTLGKIVPGYEARLVGPDGKDVDNGEIGTLWVKGDSAALCYWHAHEKSKEVLRGDWVVSGDLFTRDSDGRFRYVGRADDLLKVGGIFVSPLEVEGALLTHAAVLETCVVGYEDEEGLVKALAYVVLRAPAAGGEALAAELLEHARSRLARYKVPRRIEFVPELPRSDRGKVLRRVLTAATGKSE